MMCVYFGFGVIADQMPTSGGHRIEDQFQAYSLAMANKS
jgi:hypothetical protein